MNVEETVKKCKELGVWDQFVPLYCLEDVLKEYPNDRELGEVIRLLINNL